MAYKKAKRCDGREVEILDGKVDKSGITWYLCEVAGEGRAWIMADDLAIYAD